MDGENNGKPYEQMDDLGKTHYFRKHPYSWMYPDPNVGPLGDIPQKNPILRGYL